MKETQFFIDIVKEDPLLYFRGTTYPEGNAIWSSFLLRKLFIKCKKKSGEIMFFFIGRQAVVNVVRTAFWDPVAGTT